MYRPVILKGTYKERQREANRIGAICYYEQHFNSSSYSTARGSEVLVAHNGSEKSKMWARNLVEKWQKYFSTRLRANKGVRVLEKGARGDWNLRWTNMPAILGEPFFVSNKKEVRFLCLPEIIARAVVKSILEMFPEGGVVALSIGHKYKKKVDRGARCYGNWGWEADYNERVIEIIKNILLCQRRR